MDLGSAVGDLLESSLHMMVTRHCLYEVQAARTLHDTVGTEV